MKVQVRLPSKQSQTSRDISLGRGEFEWEVEQRDDYQLWPQSSCRGGCSSLPHWTSKLLKEQTSMKTMEEQFPGLTVGTKWGQVAPGVACSVLWRLFWSRVQTEALILPAVGSFVGCWQFSANLSPGTALSHRVPPFPRLHCSPGQRSSWITSWEGSAVTVINSISPSVHFYFLYPHPPTDADLEGTHQ